RHEQAQDRTGAGGLGLVAILGVGWCPHISLTGRPREEPAGLGRRTLTRHAVVRHALARRAPTSRRLTRDCPGAFRRSGRGSSIVHARILRPGDARTVFDRAPTVGIDPALDSA